MEWSGVEWNSEILTRIAWDFSFGPDEWVYELGVIDLFGENEAIVARNE